MILGAIEAGGTKFVVGIGNEKGELIERKTIPTRSPDETLDEVIHYFKDKKIAALGVGCFGPLDLNPNSDSYGSITKTPKEGWTDFNILKSLKEGLKIPVTIDTDVNAAALGESKYGIGKGLNNVLYLTIGTGIGGGAIVEGKLLHGMLHPEMGHILLARRDDDPYQGKCTFHQQCFEGLASGPAIEERWGIKASELEIDHPAWDLEAYYIAQAFVNYILILSPEIIVLGGGVMHQKQLFENIHRYTTKFLNHYVQRPEIMTENIKNYIVAPGLNDDSGIIGALALAQEIYQQETSK